MAHVPKAEGKAGPGQAPGPDGARQVLPNDDRELVRRAQKDEKEAFELLVERHKSRVFAVAGGILRNREDVEDAAQQVFLKAFFSLKRFDQRAAFSTWLYKITVNECWDVLRKRKVRPLVFEAELSEEQAQIYRAAENVADGTPDISEKLETRQELDRLLECLDERDRLMLVLKEVRGFSVEEIAAILEINGNTVKVRLFRARQRIVERMKRKEAAKA